MMHVLKPNYEESDLSLKSLEHATVRASQTFMTADQGAGCKTKLWRSESRCSLSAICGFRAKRCENVATLTG